MVDLTRDDFIRTKCVEFGEDDPELLSVHVFEQGGRIFFWLVSLDVDPRGEVLPFRFVYEGFEYCIITLHPDDWAKRDRLDWSGPPLTEAECRWERVTPEWSFLIGTDLLVRLQESLARQMAQRPDLTGQVLEQLRAANEFADRFEGKPKDIYRLHWELAERAGWVPLPPKQDGAPAAVEDDCAKEEDPYDDA